MLFYFLVDLNAFVRFVFQSFSMINSSYQVTVQSIASIFNMLSFSFYSVYQSDMIKRHQLTIQQLKNKEILSYMRMTDVRLHHPISMLQNNIIYAISYELFLDHGSVG